MIDIIKFGTMIQPLEDLFGDRTPGQRKVLYEKFKFTKPEFLQAAIDHLRDTAKYFPRPGEIETAVRDFYYKKQREGSSEFQVKGCPQCHDGYVLYEKSTRDGFKLYVGDCAICHKGEKSLQAQLIQKDDEIFFACVQAGDKEHFIADPNTTEQYREASPYYSSKDLYDQFHNK